jgi:hypothetical protein
MTHLGRNVVLWSGGLDSTTVLHGLAPKSDGEAVVALAISDHMGAPQAQFKRQARARRNYLKFAKAHKLNVLYQEIQVTGSAMMQGEGFFEGRVEFASLREWQVFLPWILPFLRSGDRLFFGYENISRELKVKAITSLLRAYSRLTGWYKPPTVCIPLVDFMGPYPNPLPQIPRNCVSSCDEPKGLKDCGLCNKCYRVDEHLSKTQPVVPTSAW